MVEKKDTVFKSPSELAEEAAAVETGAASPEAEAATPVPTAQTVHADASEPKRDQSRYFLRQGFVLLVVVVVCWALAAEKRALPALEDLSYDLRHKILARLEDRPASGTVAVIQIDDKSLVEIKERWPFNRRYMARLIELISQDDPAGIVVDVLHAYPSRYDEGQDEALASAIASAKCVALSTYRPVDRTTTKARHPYRTFRRGAAGVGHANLNHDFWGYTRFIHLYGGCFKIRQRSLVLEALRTFYGHQSDAQWVERSEKRDRFTLQGRRGREVSLPLLKHGWYEVNHRFIEALPRYSFADVYKKRLPRGIFRGRLVFIGVTASLVHDDYDTPVARRVGGVCLFACAAETIINGTSIERPGGWLRLLLVALALCLAFGYASLRSPALGLGLTLVTAFLWFIVALVALQHNLWLETLPMIVGIWPLYYLATIVVTIRAGHRQAEAVKQLLAAGKRANIEPNLLHHINQTFGLDGRVASGGIGPDEPLPTGMRVLSSFIDAKYENVELIGKGGMGLVVRADDWQRDRTVAIKILSPLLLEDELALRRFEREMDVMARMDHPNIVKVFQRAGGDFPYLVMEYLRGENLRTHLNRLGHLGHDSFFRIFRHIIQGLAYAHGQGVVHRDLKPENIFLEDDDRAKILDFGLAHVSEGTQLTKSGLIMGTFRYMAPEQREGTLVTNRTDIYSLGVVMLESVLGTVEFVRKFGNYGQTALSTEGVDGSWRALEGLIRRCVEPDPQRRPESVAEVLDELEQTRDAYDQRGVATQRIADD